VPRAADRGRPVNDLLEKKLAANELILCLSLSQARTVDIAMMAAACDFDAIYVDLEHTATSLETAEHIVEVCKFPPLGHRSISGPNPVTWYRPMSPAENTEYMNRQTILAAMLETPAAIEKATEIAATPGLDMIATPHTAGITQEATRAIAVATAEQWVEIFRGSVPPRLVNPEAWPRYSERFEQLLGFRPAAMPSGGSP
jgi:2-keto-3-deoxy-L-rhamnonate aldolase RhmA